MQKIAADPAMKDVLLGAINHAQGVLAVAVPMLQGELALAKGQHKTGIARLRDAVKAEDVLAYNKPADWPLPIRPYLGAALLDAGRAGEARMAYQQDLVTYPKNGWSLYGLAKAQRKLGDVKSAKQSERRYKDAWQWSDTPLTASRL